MVRGIHGKETSWKDERTRKMARPESREVFEADKLYGFSYVLVEPSTDMWTGYLIPESPLHSLERPLYAPRNR